jgi:hypothetical protein
VQFSSYPSRRSRFFPHSSPPFTFRRYQAHCLPERRSSPGIILMQHRYLASKKANSAVTSIHLRLRPRGTAQNWTLFPSQTTCLLHLLITTADTTPRFPILLPDICSITGQRTCSSAPRHPRQLGSLQLVSCHCIGIFSLNRPNPDLTLSLGKRKLQPVALNRPKRPSTSLL